MSIISPLYCNISTRKLNPELRNRLPLEGCQELVRSANGLTDESSNCNWLIKNDSVPENPRPVRDSKLWLEVLNSLGVSLKGANLQGYCLNGIQLPEANLGESNLQNIQLKEANLRNANISHTSLDNADLSGADLSSANLEFSKANEYLNAKSSNFEGANLTSLEAHEPQLTKTNFKNTNLTNAFFSMTEALDEISQINNNFQGANFTGAIFADGVTTKETEGLRGEGEALFQNFDSLFQGNNLDSQILEFYSSLDKTISSFNPENPLHRGILEQLAFTVPTSFYSTFNKEKLYYFITRAASRALENYKWKMEETIKIISEPSLSDSEKRERLQLIDSSIQNYLKPITDNKNSKITKYEVLLPKNDVDTSRLRLIQNLFRKFYPLIKPYVTSNGIDLPKNYFAKEVGEIMKQYFVSPHLVVTNEQVFSSMKIDEKGKPQQVDWTTLQFNLELVPIDIEKETSSL